MEFDELLITTGVDALVRLVKDKNKIELDMASKLLNIDSSKIEEWARILEEQGIIKIDYHLTKVYLAWVTPTEEEIKEEEVSFYEEKGEVSKEISRIKSSIGPEAENLDELKKSFSEIYSKLSPRMDEISHQLASLGALADAEDKEATKERFGQIATIYKKMSDMETSVKDLKDSIKEIETKAAQQPGSISIPQMDEFKKRMQDMSERLSSLDKKISGLSKSYPSEIPSSSEIKKKFELLGKEFSDIKRANAKLRDDLIGLHESSDILATVADSTKKYEGTIESMKSDLSDLLKELDTVNLKSSALAVKVKEDIESMEHYSDSINVAKGILERFPNQDKVLKQLDETGKKEADIDAKLAALDSVIGSLSLPKNILTEITQVRKQVEDERRDVIAESQKIFDAIDDQSTTYATFQKIKEKTIASLEVYSIQLNTLEEALSKLKDEAAKIEVAMSEQAKKIKGKLKDEDIQGLIKSAKELEKKKQMLDDINNSISALTATAENLSRKINLLSKQAELISLRTGGVSVKSDTHEITQKENEVRNQVKLTRDEEAEFNRKREELREMIKKLWEQS